ncbi:hypothetical protein PV325_009487, partial [Microctonus aethiopoides]
YTGPNLLSVIDNFKCPERPVIKPFRFSVNDIFKGTGSGFCASGHVVTGMIAVGNKVLLLPGNEIAIVKGIDQQKVGIGDIICTPNNPIPVTTSFQSHVIIFAIAIPIIKGLPVVLHVQSLVQPAVITKLVKQLHRSTGEVIKHKPRCLLKNSSAIIEITTQRPICLELYKDIKQLGRVMLRVSGTTIAAGLVTKINGVVGDDEIYCHNAREVGIDSMTKMSGQTLSNKKQKCTDNGLSISSMSSIMNS